MGGGFLLDLLNMQKIIHGDCLEVMKTFPDNHFSAIVTDPPYGLKFMGKQWDHGIPDVPFWVEILRVSKPGTHLLAFGGTRTYHRLTCAIEDAGWEIRDCLSWLYGSGFPKSHNRFGIEGFGTALKPAWEPIIMAMKPCDGTFKQNAEKWGQAGINIDESRIPVDKQWTRDTRGQSPLTTGEIFNRGCKNILKKGSIKGRWPANLILDEEAAVMLDEQSGNCGGKWGKQGKFKPKSMFYVEHKDEILKESGKYIGSKGGASRFFYCAKASSRERNKGLNGLIPRPIRKESREGNSHDIFNTEGSGRNTDNKLVNNFHPTVKPLKLMEYLIKLVMPLKDGLLLDPFVGSGTTILAAKNLGFDAIGIEKYAEYVEIANGRISVEEQKCFQF